MTKTIQVQCVILLFVIKFVPISMTYSLDTVNANPCCSGTNFLHDEMFCEDDTDELSHLMLPCSHHNFREYVILDPKNKPMDNFTIDGNGYLHLSPLHSFIGDEKHVIPPHE